MSPEQIAIIIVNILSFPFLIDGILLIMLIFSFLIGFWKKGWHALWRFIFVIVLLAVAAIFCVKPLATYLAGPEFFALIGYQPTIDYGGASTITVHSFTELIAIIGRLSTDRAKFTIEYSTLLAFNMAKAAAWFALVLVIHVVSWIVSAIFWPLAKLAIPKSVRKRELKPLGGILGFAQTIVIIASYMFATSAIGPGFSHLYTQGQYSAYGINGYLVGVATGLDPINSWLFGWLSLDGNVFQYSYEDTVYYVDTEFLDLTTSMIDEECDEACRISIIEDFEEECFDGEGNFICTIG